MGTNLAVIDEKSGETETDIRWVFTEIVHRENESCLMLYIRFRVSPTRKSSNFPNFLGKQNTIIVSLR